MLVSSMTGVAFAHSFPSADRLSKQSPFGRIAVHSARNKKFPENAEVSFSRTRARDVESRIADGFAKKRPQRSRFGGRAAAPSVLAMYDISIRHGGRKWQPAAGDPVRVTMELDEPVSVSDASALGVVHLADDGTVETLDASRYGFTYNAARSAVTAFWFDASGFSVYAIVETEGGDLLVPRRFYHFYDRSTVVTNGAVISDVAYPYPYEDRTNDVVNVQIVKDGDLLVEPPIPPNHVSDDQISVFKGWYVVKSAARAAGAEDSKLDSLSEPFNFIWPQGVSDSRLVFTNAVSVTETVDTDYWVVPLYENARFLLFYEQVDEETGEVGTSAVARKLVALNDEAGESERILVSDVSAPLRNAMDEYFSGWRYLGTDGQEHDLLLYTMQGMRTNSYLNVDNALFEANGGGDSIPLVPIYVRAHFLNFDTAAKGSGAGYVPSLFVRSNSEIFQLETCSRNGYLFAGWWTGTMNEGRLTYGVQVTDADGNFLKGLHVTDTNNVEYITTDAMTGRLLSLAKDTTVYAKWTTTENTSYRVVVWQQKATDGLNIPVESNTYDYVEYYVSGGVAPGTAVTDALVTNFTGKDSSGNAAPRNLTALNFTGFHYRANSCMDAEVAPDGTTVINLYYDRDVHTLTFGAVNGYISETRTITALYGANISAHFPIAGVDNMAWTDTGSVKTYNYVLATLETMPAVDVTFSGEHRTNKGTIRYYVETVDNEPADTTFNGRRYKLHKTVVHGFNFLTYDEDFHDINGFSRSRSSADPAFSAGNDQASIPTSKVNNLYYNRNSYTLIYWDGDEHVATSAPIPYEASLAGQDLPASSVNWGERDTTHYTFEGWFEDASLTQAFDFNGKMPAANKTVYAKWAPVKYKVIIDPNGGTLQSGDATWFYLDYDEKVDEYFVSRDYRLDMINGTFGYSIAPYDPSKDKYSDQYDPTANRADRHAYYTEDASDITTGQDPRYDGDKRYVFEPGAYVFMGWFEVDEHGVEQDVPFNFSKPMNKPLTLRAVWRRAGVYTLRYESHDPDGTLPDVVVKDPAASTAHFEGYADGGDTTIIEGPSNYDSSQWILEGWQVVDSLNDNIPLSDILSPGDIYVVNSLHADRSNVIHLRAVFTRKGDGTSKHVPQVVGLVLDSNADAGIDEGYEVAASSTSVGTYTNGTVGELSGLNQGVWFAGQMDNFSVALANYAPAFAHKDGFFLLGWDTRRNCADLIPEFAGDATVGADKSTASANVLYAVWEPQIMIEFTNETGVALSGIKLEVPAWASGELFRVNTVTGAYGREAFTAFADGSATFDLGVGEVLRLVLPDSADMEFSVSGTSGFADGSKLVVTRTAADGAGTATSTAYPGTHYLVSGVMKVSETPVRVAFSAGPYPTKADVPVRYFLHEPDGATVEITDKDSYWQNTNYKKSLTLTGAQTDLAEALRRSAGAGVHDYLAPSVLAAHGHTTIGIGSTNVVNEYRAMATTGVSGGPYVRFAGEKVEWMRDAQNGIAYGDAAVYVMFYKRVPVPITVTKSVVGTEADKDSANQFPFKAEFTAHSRKFTRTVRTRYTATRELVETRQNSNSPWYESSQQAGSDSQGYYQTTAWAVTGTNELSDTSVEDQTKVDADVFSPPRGDESFGLADAQSHKMTLFYDSISPIASDTVSPEAMTPGTYRYWTGSRWSRNSGNNRNTRWSTQTTNWTETIVYDVTYKYETVEITETATGARFELTDIAHEQDGTENLGGRKYTVSSLKSAGNNVYTYQAPDVATFTNTRQTSTLTVTQSVVDGDAGDQFGFVVTLDAPLTGFSAEGVTVSADGKHLFFHLTGGDSKALDLPVGIGYSVTEDYNARYNVSSENASGKLGMDPVTVTFTNTRKADLFITVNSKTTHYNAAEQAGYGIDSVTGASGGGATADAYTVTGLKSGDVLTVVGYVAARGTEAGKYNGDFANAVVTVTRGTEDVTAQYFLTGTAAGDLTINKTPIVVTVTGQSATKAYSGELQIYDVVEQGWVTVEIENAQTHKPLADPTVHAVIDANYRLVSGKELGTYPMSLLSPGAVSVYTVTDSYEVQLTVANGSFEITRAPVIVTADDKSKWPNAADPALTATVTGLHGTDTVSYDISRAPGEAKGDYAITVTGAAEQGNYTVTYVNGTFTIKGLVLIQRATGEELPVAVPVTDELLTRVGLAPDVAPNEANAFLNAVDQNGLRRWENLVMGTPIDEVPVGTTSGGSGSGGSGSGDPATIAASMSPVPDEDAKVDLGYTVLRDLRKKCDGSAWSRVAGPAFAGNPKFDIRLADAAGGSCGASGLYRVYTLLVPNAMLSITNEIPATNVIGVLEVNSTTASTITAVPWKFLASDPAKATDITVSNYVAGVNISAGDAVYALDSSARAYRMWKRASDGAWETSTTVSGKADGTYSVTEAGLPDVATLPRGGAAWVQRAKTDRPYFLVGQYDASDVSVEVPGATDAGPGLALLAAPFISAVDLNGIDWSAYPVDAKDTIRIVENGVQTNLSYDRSSKKWGTYETKTVTWFGASFVTSQFKPYGKPIPAGTGFFYFRASSTGFTFTWK